MREFKSNNVIIRKFNMKDVSKAESVITLDAEMTRLAIKSAINEFYTDEPTWAVENKKSKNLIGYIKVNNFSSKNRICNIKWFMSEKYWDEESMIDAITKVCNFLFTKKNIDLVESTYYINTLDEDKKGNIMKNVGMKQEAVLRNRRINKDTNIKEDYIVYSVDKKEFMENSAYNKWE